MKTEASKYLVTDETGEYIECYRDSEVEALEYAAEAAAHEGESFPVYKLIAVAEVTTQVTVSHVEGS